MEGSLTSGLSSLRSSLVGSDGTGVGLPCLLHSSSRSLVGLVEAAAHLLQLSGALVEVLPAGLDDAVEVALRVGQRGSQVLHQEVGRLQGRGVVGVGSSSRRRMIDMGGGCRGSWRGSSGCSSGRRMIDMGGKGGWGWLLMFDMGANGGWGRLLMVDMGALKRDCRWCRARAGCSLLMVDMGWCGGSRGLDSSACRSLLLRTGLGRGWGALADASAWKEQGGTRIRRHPWGVHADGKTR